MKNLWKFQTVWSTQSGEPLSERLTFFRLWPKLRQQRLKRLFKKRFVSYDLVDQSERNLVHIELRYWSYRCSNFRQLGPLNPVNRFSKHWPFSDFRRSGVVLRTTLRKHILMSRDMHFKQFWNNDVLTVMLKGNGTLHSQVSLSSSSKQKQVFKSQFRRSQVMWLRFFSSLRRGSSRRITCRSRGLPAAVP